MGLTQCDFSHSSPHTADLWKCLETILVGTTQGRREGATVMDRTQRCCSKSYNVQHYPPTTKNYPAPNVSPPKGSREEGTNKTGLLPTDRHYPLPLWLLSQHREPELRQPGIPDGVISSRFLSLHSKVQISFCESCLSSISMSLAPNSDLRTLLVTIPMKETKTCPLLETHRDFWKQGQWRLLKWDRGIKLWSKRMYCSHPSPFPYFSHVEVCLPGTLDPPRLYYILL